MSGKAFKLHSNVTAVFIFLVNFYALSCFLINRFQLNHL